MRRMKLKMERQKECIRSLVHRNPQTLYMQLVWALSPKLIIPKISRIDSSVVPWVALECKKSG